MTRHQSRRTGTRLTRRVAGIIADCNHASRRRFELTTSWLTRNATTAPRPARPAARAASVEVGYQRQRPGHDDPSR